ncbi:uncharacterized protein LTR77_000163 [Saxophila tyrrhenica]|uniref:Ras GEF n=1 Tax=Saxophila tyrrhenica TaxID=1690608 RepID=A0AAV9PQ23_9PEZI|nr:hypothetical protein LTR77_000163 [Saxophila tyrrhenica]
MPPPSSSRRSSKSGPSSSSNDAQHNSSSKSSGSERREKAKSSQYEGTRRGSRQVEGSGGLGVVREGERPGMKGRTNSAPTIESGGRNGGGGGKGVSDARRGEAGAGAEDARDEDEVAGVVGAVKRFQPFQNPEISEPVPDINIAILGAEGVGKSTFMQKALDLDDLPGSQAAERKLSIKGEEYIVRLLELSIDDVDIDEDDNTVSWPETIEDKMMPRIDGALTLYDVKDQGSLEYVPEMLRAINKTGIPSVLVSCKCDASPEEAEVDPADVENRARRSLKVVDTLQTSASTPETHKRGLSMILRAILSAPPKDEARSSTDTRRRAQSSAVRPVSPRPPSHTRATSEYTGSISKDSRHSRHDSSGPGYHSKDRLGVPHEEPQQEMPQSFLFEESTSEASFESTASASEGARQHALGTVQPVSALSENGATFDELVDRLLAQPTSKVDSKFTAIFLALYRKFAAPGRLLEAIVERFDALERNGNALLIKTVSQLRYVSILEQWVGTYPGDFAFPKTKKRMRTFVSKLSQERIFGVAAKEINAELDGVQEDDDTHWGYCDKDRDSKMSDRTVSSLPSTASKLLDDPRFSFGSEFTLSGSTLLDDPSVTHTPDTDAPRSMSSSTLSSQVMISAEAAQRQAELLQPVPRLPLSKTQWRLLMEYPDDLIARELTRMDWLMFSSIRPRDLVRQVSLSDEQKATCKNLVHVNRMIDHFNHLASWVANYMLLRDKPKHRALMLEKFMRVARKLREMNNYNALGAIIAGVKSTAVHRLGATRELIPQHVGKDWLKLEILMAPTRSFFAYRLAWENSSSERIPYLPLPLRDLMGAEQGNETFLGEGKERRVNWKKFEIMGEVIVGLQKAQGMPYRGLGGTGRAGEGVRELVLDVRLVRDEDELFERSKHVEPSGSAAGGTSTKFKEFFKR